MDTLTPVAVGDSVTYVDPTGKPHQAVVTSVFGDFHDTALWTKEQVEAVYARWPDDIPNAIERLVGTPHTVPSMNVVYVSSDESQTDSYGRQIARATSVPHRSAQAAHGNYWQ